MSRTETISCWRKLSLHFWQRSEKFLLGPHKRRVSGRVVMSPNLLGRDPISTHGTSPRVSQGPPGQARVRQRPHQACGPFYRPHRAMVRITGASGHKSQPHPHMESGPELAGALYRCEFFSLEERKGKVTNERC